MPPRDAYRRRTSVQRAERHTAKLRTAIKRCAEGEFLARARAERGQTQAQVGERVGKSPTVISRVETGLGGFKNDLVDQIIDYLQSIPVPEVTDGERDSRPLRERYDEQVTAILDEIASAGSDEALGSLLLRVQKDTRRTLPPVLVQAHSAELMDSLDLSPVRSEDPLRAAQSATRSVMAKAIERADSLPEVEARLYLMQIRNLVDTLASMDTVALERVEHLIRNLARQDDPR